jgi:ATP-binding cassette subfamily F protein uup
MNYLSAENLSKSFGDHVLFENLSLGLSKGDKTAIVANNGAGKSTLMKILAGRESSDTGKVTLREGIRTGYLEQEPALNDKQTILELISGEHSPVQSVIRAYEKALAEQEKNHNPTTHRAFEEAAEHMNQWGAWDYESRMKSILSRFGITDLHQSIGSLSGGQKKTACSFAGTAG